MDELHWGALRSLEGDGGGGGGAVGNVDDGKDVVVDFENGNKCGSDGDRLSGAPRAPDTRQRRQQRPGTTTGRRERGRFAPVRRRLRRPRRHSRRKLAGERFAAASTATGATAAATSPSPSEQRRSAPLSSRHPPSLRSSLSPGAVCALYLVAALLAAAHALLFSASAALLKLLGQSERVSAWRQRLVDAALRRDNAAVSAAGAGNADVTRSRFLTFLSLLFARRNNGGGGGGDGGGSDGAAGRFARRASLSTDGAAVVPRTQASAAGASNATPTPTPEATVATTYFVCACRACTASASVARPSEALVSQVRARLGALGFHAEASASSEWCSAETIARFLDTAHDQPGEAARLLAHTLRWRRGQAVHALKADDFAADLRAGSIRFGGFDVAGRPVLIVRVNKRFSVRCLVFALEVAETVMDRRITSARGGGGGDDDGDGASGIAVSGKSGGGGERDTVERKGSGGSGGSSNRNPGRTTIAGEYDGGGGPTGAPGSVVSQQRWVWIIEWGHVDSRCRRDSCEQCLLSESELSAAGDSDGDDDAADVRGARGASSRDDDDKVGGNATAESTPAALSALPTAPAPRRATRAPGASADAPGGSPAALSAPIAESDAVASTATQPVSPAPPAAPPPPPPPHHRQPPSGSNDNGAGAGKLVHAFRVCNEHYPNRLAHAYVVGAPKPIVSLFNMLASASTKSRVEFVRVSDGCDLGAMGAYADLWRRPWPLHDFYALLRRVGKEGGGAEA